MFSNICLLFHMKIALVIIKLYKLCAVEFKTMSKAYIFEIQHGLWGTKLHLTILEVYMNLVYPKTYSIDLPFCRGLSHQSDLGKWGQNFT